MTDDSLDPTGQTTRTTWKDTVNPDNSLRVPGLVIAGHHDWQRVGEEIALPQLASGSTVIVSRQEPAFAMPREERFRPLGDAYLSRRPIQLCPGSELGSITIDRLDSPTTLLANGQEVQRAHTFSAEEVTRGVVLVLGRRVTLLLQPVDPVPVSIPHFGLVGESAAALRLRQDIASAGKLNIPVLLRGETGTGKEIVARALHDVGTRRHGPYRTVSLAALPASLAAAELFGAVRGAYTGAERRKVGFFESARGGTLFLDEVGEAPVEVQVMLLRALETSEIQPLGSVDTVSVDVRVIAATDARLESLIADGRFRAPLLHRLAGFEIHLPNLRQRRDDVARLLIHFLRQELGPPPIHEGHDAQQDGLWPPAWLTSRLLAFDWPGNVRQLRNVSRRLTIAYREHMSDPSLHQLVERLLVTRSQAASTSGGAESPRTDQENADGPSSRASRKLIDVSEAELLAALEGNRWQLTSTAAALGVSRSTLYRLIEDAPSVRKASELHADEVASALKDAGGSVNKAALALRVSPQGLKRKIRSLDLS